MTADAWLVLAMCAIAIALIVWTSREQVKTEKALEVEEGYSAWLEERLYAVEPDPPLEIEALRVVLWGLYLLEREHAAEAAEVAEVTS